MFFDSSCALPLFLQFGPGGPKIGKLAQMGEDAALVEEVKSLEGIALEKGVDMKFSAEKLSEEKIVSNTFGNIAKNPSMRESFELFEKAQNFLKPYTKEFMSEAKCREFIHQTGIPTFPKPPGIPENFRTRISNKGAGIIYMHPDHTHTSIRIMPGKPHSPFVHQQKPYVIYRKNGKTLDKFGNSVDPASAEAHIPLEDFVFKDQL